MRIARIVCYGAHTKVLLNCVCWLNSLNDEHCTLHSAMNRGFFLFFIRDWKFRAGNLTPVYWVGIKLK